jgi:predicted transcriptional regulator
MEAIYLKGKASVAEVIDCLHDAPGYSSVRKILQILEEKGHVRHTQQGQHYIYIPTQPRNAAARSAMKKVLDTFFGGNVENAVLTLISEAEVDLTDEDIARLTSLIDAAKSAERPES